MSNEHTSSTDCKGFSFMQICSVKFTVVIQIQIHNGERLVRRIRR